MPHKLVFQSPCLGIGGKDAKGQFLGEFALQFPRGARLPSLAAGDPGRHHLPVQNMVLHVTDPELLRRTGGIVQGMSGSPIIQNGML